MRTNNFVHVILFCVGSTTSFNLVPTSQAHRSELASLPTRTVETTSKIDHATFQNALRGSKSDATLVLDQLIKSGDQEARETLLTGLLQEIPSHFPTWARLRLLGRFSRRARLASLERTIGLWSIPSSDRNQRDELRRRGRALVSILQTISEEDATTIVNLEKRVQKDVEKTLTPEEWIQRRPSELETPNYEVVDDKPKFQVRSYEDFSVCTFSMNESKGESSEGSVTAFRSLAGYLFGKNNKETAMKMTTPVLTEMDDTNNRKKMSFVLPSDFWSKPDAAPKPLPGSDVSVSKVEGSTRAVTMFGGYAGTQKVSDRRKILLKAIAQDEQWAVEDDEPCMVAQYNDPFTPPWKRLNEVSVAVKKID